MLWIPTFREGGKSPLVLGKGVAWKHATPTIVDSLVPRPSMPPVFDRLQYAKMEGEGLGNFIT